ncbi:tRNA-binding protein [Rubrivirga sp.]|uniref:tRNA-binding protein n=1 Tax=Rubrivirga sp. TaxID=1885344 RepID=UPI003C73156F
MLEDGFGPLRVKTSSAQITEHHAPGDLVGTQVAAVLNLAPKRVVGVTSEVLILASTGADGTVLLSPTPRVTDGSRVA